MAELALNPPGTPWGGLAEEGKGNKQTLKLKARWADAGATSATGLLSLEERSRCQNTSRMGSKGCFPLPHLGWGASCVSATDLDKVVHASDHLRTVQNGLVGGKPLVGRLLQLVFHLVTEGTWSRQWGTKRGTLGRGLATHISLLAWPDDGDSRAACFLGSSIRLLGHLLAKQGRELDETLGMGWLDDLPG